MKLPGIKKVAYMAAGDFKMFDAALKHGTTVLELDGNEWTEVCLRGSGTGLAELTEEDVFEGYVRKFSDELHAVLGEDPCIDTSAALVFRLEDVEGRVYFLGSLDQPFPAVSVKETNPRDMGSAHQWELTVSHVSQHGVLSFFDAQ